LKIDKEVARLKEAMDEASSSITSLKDGNFLDSSFGAASIWL
jgi:hypothetical protein